MAFENSGEAIDDVTCIAARYLTVIRPLLPQCVFPVRFRMPVEEKVHEYANAVMKAAGMMSEKLCECWSAHRS